ncbi:ABC transporter substrate-binding protein [Carboxydochorda subterranea]|uniref:ABC transporter substrate-binding protein n=1 Tax=Carboxydichorda subterranea TaxID=3109565 RepID=A0ABZ1C168_9FIRM|nr:ABC transporter substrate-binding protein [Limnochorda sp. L945t]WRP18067.1 ABC transporter substrate-binding protein [Limnochorda sp. L945t]
MARRTQSRWGQALAWPALLASLLVGLSSSVSGGALAQGKVLRLVLDGAKNREAELQAIAGYLRQIGVDAQVRVWEYQTLLAEAQEGTRDAYATDWGSATFSPFDLAIPKLRTQDRGNFSFYSNPEVDRLFDAASTTMDEAKARDAYVKAQRILYEDAPWIFGYYLDTIEAASARVSNWRPSVDNRINLHDVELQGGTTLVVGLRADRIQSFDPADHRDRDTETVLRNMFDGLVTRTPDGEVVPEIAESWQQPHATTYVFKLRRGVRFHNGDPLTAEDVVFTFERILSPKGLDGRPSPRLGLLGPLSKVEKVDDYTVKMTLKNPSPVFLQLLVHTQIVPHKYMEQVGLAGFVRHPVGAGPFKFVRGRLDGDIVLERFDGYYGGSPQLPPVGPARIRRIVFRMMPEPGSRIAALLAGEAHIIQEVPPDAVDRLERARGVQVKVAPGTRLYEIELNNDRLKDPRVRRALNYAVDWDEILEALYRGYAHRVATAMLPSGFGYDERLKPYPYDPDKARQLLQEAGYAVR